MQISYRYADAEVGERIIGETVFEVGWNDEFIVVKQHPHEFGEPKNNTVTNYYIIKVVHSNHYQAIKNNIIGPLKNKEFNETREKLKIPEVFEYSIQFDELD